MGWKIQLRDVEGAFLETVKLEQPSGLVYISQHKGRIKGLELCQLIELLKFFLRLE